MIELVIDILLAVLFVAFFIFVFKIVKNNPIDPKDFVFEKHPDLFSKPKTDEGSSLRTGLGMTDSSHCYQTDPSD